jgi:hypothetical protein
VDFGGGYVVMVDTCGVDFALGLALRALARAREVNSPHARLDSSAI